MPRVSPRVASAAFVGRRAELAALAELLAEAGAGRGRLALVAGESGVGKTRLADELAGRARADGARVLWGECVALGDGGELPWAPVVAALRPLARAGHPALAAARAELADVLPLETPAGGRADAEPGRVLEALLAVLDRLGRDAPVLLVLEDLHWADRSTRGLLAFLGRALCRERVLVLGTYRSDELHRRHPLRPLVAELERLERTELVELGRFTRAEQAAQLAGILGEEPEPALVERLFARTEGNALHTEELLAAGADGRGELPATLRDALVLRVESLPADAQAVLRALSAAQRADDAVLATTTGLDPRALRGALRAAVDARLLVAAPDGAYAFRHALLREAVEDDLLPGERAELHRALARARAPRAAGGDPLALAAVAHHWAAAGDAPRAFGAALAAADAAERALAPGEAAELLERALELWERVDGAAGQAGGDRVALLHRTARAHLGARDFHRAHRLLGEALGAVDRAREPRRAAALLERLGRARWELGQGEAALGAYAEGLALLPEDPPTPERAALLAGEARALMLSTRGREAVATGRAAIAVARAVGDRAVESHALTTVGTARMWRGDVDEGAADLHRAIALARADERWDDVARGQTNLIDALHAAGRSHDAIALAREAAAELDGAGWPVPWLSLVLSEILFGLGDWAAADAAADPERHTGLVGIARLFFDVRRAELALGRGDVAAALAGLTRARERAARTIEPQWHGPIGALLAEAHRRAGHLDEARAAVDAGLARLAGDDAQDGVWVARLAAAGASVEADAALLARATARPQDAEAAVARAAGLVERAREALLCTRADAQPELTAHVATAAAELERARDAPADWEGVAAAWDALERPYPAALARRRAAEQHAAAGERAEATSQARAARAAAERVGARWLVDELDGLVRRARLAAPEPAAADGDGNGAEPAPFGLTPREQEVLALLAEGRTNREIGATLFMAEKTASVHVSRILAKLDVRTRTEAAVLGHRLLPSQG